MIFCAHSAFVVQSLVLMSCNIIWMKQSKLECISKSAVNYYREALCRPSVHNACQSAESSKKIHVAVKHMYGKNTPIKKNK